MIAKYKMYTPSLYFWNCDRYPYYITSIKSIQRIIAPIETGILTPAPTDQLHIILNGKASYKLVKRSQESIFYDVSKNDILFMPSGRQKYIITETSNDFELIIIQFAIFTCPDTFTQSTKLDFSEILKAPIEHKRMDVYLPPLTRYNNGDEIHNHISKIIEEYKLQKTGSSIKMQAHFLQLILEILNKLNEKYSQILENIDCIGITSKYSPYTAMKKSSVLTVSDVEIFDNNPNSKFVTAKLLNVFPTKSSYKLDPKDDNLILTNYFDSRINSNTFEISANKDTVYHIWLTPDKTSDAIYDLRPYTDTAYIRFYAKCNTEMLFGVVVYNHNIHRCIIHSFTIKPSKDFTEYCVPIMGSNMVSKSNPHINKVVTYIKTHYDHKILLEDIAKHTHLNATYLSSLFKEQTGQSISDYILDYRLGIAKNLLVDLPNAPISEIALSSGFYDTAHFSKAFKKQYGVTAREYRNGQKSLNNTPK